MHVAEHGALERLYAYICDKINSLFESHLCKHRISLSTYTYHSSNIVQSHSHVNYKRLSQFHITYITLYNVIYIH